MERVCRDLAHVEPQLRVVCLRYFNPAGAHPSGRLGEDPCGVPQNLCPLVAQVAIGRRRGPVEVYGGDWPTPDGTCVRDYVHVVDVAEGHVRALEMVMRVDSHQAQVLAYDLGTGRGYSVLEVIRAMEHASHKTIPYKVVERRPGDVALLTADPSLAHAELGGWRAVRGLDEVVLFSREGDEMDV